MKPTEAGQSGQPWPASGSDSPGDATSMPSVSSPLDRSISESLHTSLLYRVRDGDDEAWHVVVQLYTPMVYRLCRRCGVQEVDAEDIAQEVFRSVSRAVGKFDRQSPGSSFRGWLWTIARNKIRDHVRAKTGRANAVGGSQIQQRMVEIPDVEFDDDESLAQPTEDDEQRLLQLVLESIRKEFEPTTWTAFWRATVKGETAGEIADDLGMSKPAIRQAKYRVLRRLRKEIGKVT